MVKKIKEYINPSEELSPRERIIRIIMSVAIIMSIIAILQTIFLTTNQLVLVPLTIVFLAMLIGLIMTYKYRKVEASAVIIAISCVYIAFPAMFFMSGGIQGGATVYAVLGIFYCIGMFQGRQMRIMVAITLVIDSVIYLIGYFYPNTITAMGSRQEYYFDSFLAIVIVGIVIGFATKYMLDLYTKRADAALSEKNEISDMSEARTEFFASMSHELRTPVNTIIGLNEVLLREDALSPDARENVITVQNASNMLLALVNDILDMSKIESNNMKLTPVNYKTYDLFRELSDMIAPRCAEKGIEFIVDVDTRFPSKLNGDDRRIKQILLNILTNAVKYTKTGRIILCATFEASLAGQVKMNVSVEDTGMGIKKENLDTLFDSFTRVNNLDSRTIEGTGLGLAICKQLSNLMGGDVTVDSIYMKGSTFTFTVNQKVVDSAPIGDVSFSARLGDDGEVYHQLFEAPEAEILVVDDNAMNRMVATKLLKETKVNIECVSSGEEALEKTKEKYYHVILMDYYMPGLDGEETTKLIHTQENGLSRNSAFIVLTADTNLSDNELVRAKGFDTYVEKPFQGLDLEEKILALLPEDIVDYTKAESDHIEKIQKAVYRFRKKKVLLSTDCTADMDPEILKNNEISCKFLYINTKKCRFCDTEELTSDNMLRFVEDIENVYSEPASVEDYEDYFANLLAEAENVIHISPGRKLGASYDRAVAAAKSFSHVTVVDSDSLSGGMALLVLEAQKMIDSGLDCHTICERLEEIKPRIANSFLLPEARVFHKRGYVASGLAFVLDIFNIHPAVFSSSRGIHVRYGYFGNLEQARRRYVVRRIFWRRVPNLETVVLSQAGLSVGEVESLVETIKESAKVEHVIVQRCSVTNACFAGEGAIGLAFIDK